MDPGQSDKARGIDYVAEPSPREACCSRRDLILKLRTLLSLRVMLRSVAPISFRSSSSFSAAASSSRVEFCAGARSEAPKIASTSEVLNLIILALSR